MSVALSAQEIKTIRQFLGSHDWQSIKAKWTMDYPNVTATTDAQLLRNAIGFDYWHKAIERLESYAEGKVKERPEKDEGALEYINNDARPPQ